MCKNFDFVDMSWNELEALEKAIHFEKMHRKEKRFNELAKAAADALNALKAEYPYVELNFTAGCEDCGGDNEINLFDYIKHLGSGDFCMG